MAGNLYARSARISNYRLLGLVGQGQFGRVFCAIHRRTGQMVALKELKHDRFPTHKFLRELRFLLSLQHPNIVTCRSLEHTANGRYLVMDYCESGTLRNVVMEEARLHPAQSLKLVMDILLGLEHAHSRGIVHCDIKPENILLQIQPTGWLGRISDFGIARLSQELNQDFNTTGSPAYMAPERFYGQYSPTSDLYAVGIILFELLVGERPFSGTPADLMSAHLNRPVQIPSFVPDALQAVIRKALQKLNARRFHSAAEMLAALRSAAQATGWIVDTSMEIPTAPLFCQFATAAAAFPMGDAKPTGLTTSPLTATFAPTRQEPLKAPISDLCVQSVPATPQTLATETLYCLSRQWVYCRTFTPSVLTGQEVQRSVCHLPAPAQSLTILQGNPAVNKPRGGVAIAAQAVYYIPFPTPGNETPTPGLDPTTVQPVCVLSQETESAIAIDPHGYWLAAAPRLPSTPKSSLYLWPWPRLSPQRTLECRSSQIAQIIALDSAHGVAISHCHRTQASRLEVFNRRGRFLGHLNVPVMTGAFFQGIKPYRLMTCEYLAVSRCQPTTCPLDNCPYPASLLVLDLKPFRVIRLPVAVVPTLVAAAPWGYVLADAAGTLLFLDSSGQQVGQVAGPAQPTAIACVGNKGLLLATWDETAHSGCLYTVDLHQLNLDLLF
ncbi:serine/threonine-protein kinase [Trichothermofontia sp.]